MTNWSEKYNALPRDVRRIGAAMESRTRIQHLNFEKERLKKRYRQSLAEINDHIKNCEDWLRCLDREEETLIEVHSPDGPAADSTP